MDPIRSASAAYQVSFERRYGAPAEPDRGAEAARTWRCSRRLVRDKVARERSALCGRGEMRGGARRDMIESDSPVGDTRRDLVQRRRYTFTVSPQSDQLANFRHPRHFRDQLVLV